MRALATIGLALALAGCGTAPAMAPMALGDMPAHTWRESGARPPVLPVVDGPEQFQQIIGTPFAHHLLDGAG